MEELFRLLLVSLHGLELGLLCRRKVFCFSRFRKVYRFSCYPDSLIQLQLSDTAPGIFLRQAAKISHLLQELLRLLLVSLRCLLLVSVQELLRLLLVVHTVAEKY